MEIRPERSADHQAVRSLVSQAFARDVEADLVEALRRDGDARIAMVAEDANGLAGYLMLSLMRGIDRCLALGPVAVLPMRQGQGIGTQLIDAALAQARAQAWRSVFLLGEPAFYSRFGFDARVAARFVSPYAGPYFMALELDDGALADGGKVDYPPAFEAVAERI